MGVADIDDELGLDCQTSFNGLDAKGVYRQVLIVNFSRIKSFYLSLPFSVHSCLGTQTPGQILNCLVERVCANLSSDIYTF